MRSSFTLALLYLLAGPCFSKTNLWLNAEHEEHEGMDKRLVTSNDKMVWDKGIVPYKFADNLPKEKGEAYKQLVFPVYEKYSCIRFTPWTSSTQSDYSLNHNNYLNFAQMGAKCQSFLGNAKRNGQAIFCCKAKTCLHEIGHALGFPHEQQNPLRDDHTRINYQNVKEGLEFSFEKEENNFFTYGLYDIDSLMHYALRTFSKNMLKTIDVLDKDIRPYSAYADEEAYYYYFYEINKRYKCADHCAIECYNGGYKALLDGQCGCRCPLGLDPTSQCSTVDRSLYDCGGIIYLSDDNTVAEITSPIISSSHNVTCTWYIQSPEKSRIFLDFPKFNVRQISDRCIDEVAVRFYLPGLFGAPFCGDTFPRVIQSYDNSIVISFTQTISGTGQSSFLATLSMVKDEDLCYNIENKGRNYAGHVDYAENFSPCLPWDKVRHCPHNLFNPSDYDANLDGASCRNPDGSARPWCYTEAELCQRAYCDPCQRGPCKDIFSNCAVEMSNNPNYCTQDQSATRGCRRSCGLCKNINTPLPKVSSITCDTPTKPSDAATVSLEQRYAVGDTVTFTCASDSMTWQTITCLSSGKWTHLNFVCGICAAGWVQFKDHCYKLQNTKMKRDSAQYQCARLRPGSSLFTDRSQDVHDFIVNTFKSETHRGELTWMGMSTKSGSYEWTTGTSELTYTNWDTGYPSTKKNDCVMMSINFMWKDKGCGMKYKSICEYKLIEPIVCADQRPDCPELLQRNPELCADNFAFVHCAETCAICDKTASTVTTCSDEGQSKNADLTTSTVNQGQYIEYTCRSGYNLVTGNLQRACTTSGKLTGSPPQCFGVLKYDWPVNTLAIRDRGSVGKAGYVYFANNQHFNIPVKGLIKRWLFYSKFDGQVALQVWRKTSSPTVYEFRGSNIISNTMEDRERDLLISHAERLYVKNGDMIAVYYSGEQPGGISYDICSPKWFPDDLNQLESVNFISSPFDFVKGKTYQFSLKVKFCRIFSLNALVDSK